MNWLARLKNQNAPSGIPTKPTKTISVVSVGTLPGHIQNLEGAAPPPAANDLPDLCGWRVTLPDGIQPATVATFRAASQALNASIQAAGAGAAPEPDRWCWPHSSAMNTAEITTFGARVVRFMARGLSAPDAEALADRLVKHDRDQDGLRCCLECRHLHGTGPHTWRCAAWRAAGLSAAASAHNLVPVPQHCPAFGASGIANPRP